jgi:hypothetical protein
MENLTRHDLSLRNDGHSVVAIMSPCSEGEWVKFSDIKELLQTSANMPSAPCQHDKVEVSDCGKFWQCCACKEALS